MKSELQDDGSLIFIPENDEDREALKIVFNMDGGEGKFWKILDIIRDLAVHKIIKMTSEGYWKCLWTRVRGI